MQENFQPNLKRERDRLVTKFQRGSASCYFPPNFLWRNLFHRNFKEFEGIPSCVPKGHV
jgi:hypothetical protein